MSLANVSTTRLVLDAQRLDTRTIHALRNINVLTVENSMHHITRNVVFINESMLFSILEYHKTYIFFEARAIYKNTSLTEGDELCWATKAPIQCTSVCTQCVLGWGAACYMEAKLI